MNKNFFKNNYESTFDRLRELQVLVKKESALKELCKKKQYINIIY